MAPFWRGRKGTAREHSSRAGAPRARFVLVCSCSSVRARLFVLVWESVGHRVSPPQDSPRHVAPAPGGSSRRASAGPRQLPAGPLAGERAPQLPPGADAELRVDLAEV